ncbi:hypothetical protein LPB19_06995 [Marinobacter salinisoli]|uniref:PilY1 beta-propeller domain-containing protein n=1 Tax=Marinobacter salinisoli TaxID=2769486 RepID=A0ABX7MVC5_9GAMM|nr:PilC/PilY family type IV pilus protein [Marinobacter salinisoli]QSP96128.1 hypothetical protein LPB19_06995 [Marinobacter salinisoli]
MKEWYQRACHVLAGLFICLPAASYAEVPFGDVPIFVSGSVKPNLVYAVDDSGSMDFEIVSELYDGVPVCNALGLDCKTKKYRYLFNVGEKSDSNIGGWLGNTGQAEGQVPFVPAYYYLRSSDYNAAYYNPDSTYNPWPDSTTLTFSNASAQAAKYEPTSASSKTLDLTTNTTDSDNNSFYPATYFEKTDTGTYTRNGAAYSCSDNVTGVYEAWLTSLANSSSTFSFGDGVDGFGPDDSCLKKTELSAGTPEMQNFANWFSYYRRLHHTTRAAIAESLDGLYGIRVGTFWIHNLRDIPMEDLDTEKKDFLEDTYKRFGSTYSGGGTPLRATLNHAGNQFDTNANLITAECQKNFTLLFTDGFNDSAVSGIGNADGESGSPYADTASNTLADVAMKYYSTRLRATKYDAGKVRLPEGCYKQPGDPGYDPLVEKRVESTDASYDASVDCNSNLHMNTYTVGFGAAGEEFVGNGYSSVQDVYDTPPDWSKLEQVTDWDEDQVDDLLHAAVNGRGEFYNASNVDELRKSITAAIQDIIRSTGSATNVTFNTATLEQGSEVYTASFSAADWSGSIAARSLDSTNGAIGAKLWDAAETLKTQATSERFIVTNNNGGVLFQWGNLSSAQIDDLNGTSDDNLGQDRLAYIRGDQTKETTLFRKRSTPLGDVINSSPVFVGKPASGWPDRDPFGVNTAQGRYSYFKQNKTNRTQVVYAGANDGMLHGFNADTGAEVMAYIPSFAFSSEEKQGLHYLTDPAYKHRHYVDLSPTVADVYIGSATGSGAGWKTILLGGMRSGGRGIFALDVTNPARFDRTSTAAANLVMWEFSHPDLGYITEPPLITMVKWANNDYRWSAVFSNGYNSDNGKSGLFVLDIQGGQNGWIEGTDYVFIELDADGEGLSPARIVDYKDESDNMVTDGVADRVYAGDLDGNLWAIDLTDGKSSWASAYSSGKGASAVAAPLFVATDSDGNRQPITVAPIMSRNAFNTQGDEPNLLVFLGTGRYISPTDPASKAVQSFYGIWDTGTTVARSQLATRSITQTDFSWTDAEGNDRARAVRNVGGDSIDWTDTSETAKKGWLVDFDITTEAGERVATNLMVRDGHVVFNTIVPTSNACDFGGQSWIMVLKFDGITPDTEVLDANKDGKVDSDDPVIAGMKLGTLVLGKNMLGDNLYLQGSKGDLSQVKTNLGNGKKLGRSGWREVFEE